MKFLVFFGAFVVFAILSGVIRRRRNPFVSLAFGELPEVLRNDIARFAPDFQPSTVRLTKNGDKAALSGDYQGVAATLEADFDRRGELTEFEFEAVHGSRVRSGIGPEDLPQAARAEIDRVIGADRDAFVETGLTGGTLKGEGNYKITGDVGDWRWEIEVSEGGRLLEFEREKRRR